MEALPLYFLSWELWGEEGLEVSPDGCRLWMLCICKKQWRPLSLKLLNASALVSRLPPRTDTKTAICNVAWGGGGKTETERDREILC